MGKQPQQRSCVLMLETCRVKKWGSDRMCRRQSLREVSRRRDSETSHPRLFQLFHPIWGVRARPLLTPRAGPASREKMMGSMVTTQRRKCEDG